METFQREQIRRFNEPTIDRLALSRAKHLEKRDEKTKSYTDDEIDAISDWSDSDRECCPLTDFELESNLDESIDELNIFNPKKISFVQPSVTTTTLSNQSETDKTTRQQYIKKSQQQKSNNVPLLPARRTQNRQFLARRSSIRSTTTTSQSSFSSQTTKNRRREVREHRFSPNSSIYSNEKSLLDDHQPRRNISPSSGTRTCESRRHHLDDNEYGRITEIASRKSSPPRERQKWGTIIHPPFPLGYQQVSSEQLSHVVERLSSPIRRRDRQANGQSPTKRYLTIEETTALVRLCSFVFN